MNIEIANRLVQLRKKNGLSQEELAEKLGISRQAVSKWERAEASPDTDNLICLAKLYGISLDDLLLTNSVKETTANEKEITETKFDTENKENEGHGNEPNNISMSKDGIHIVDGNYEIHIDSNLKNVDSDLKNNVPHLISGIVTSVYFFLALIIYLLFGFLTKKGWQVGWILFLLGPVISSIFTCIIKKKVSPFCMPLLATAIYCFIGLMYNLWHPYWLIMLSIPVFYMIVEPLEKAFKTNN